MSKKYIYLFIRKDLSNAQKIVQSCHAAIEMSRYYMTSIEDHPSVIIIGVKSENHLNREFKKLSDIGIKMKSFYEPMFNNEFTSFATVPINEENRIHFKKYNLITESAFQGDSCA